LGRKRSATGREKKKKIPWGVCRGGWTGEKKKKRTTTRNYPGRNKGKGVGFCKKKEGGLEIIIKGIADS